MRISMLKIRSTLYIGFSLLFLYVMLSSLNHVERSQTKSIPKRNSSQPSQKLTIETKPPKLFEPTTKPEVCHNKTCEEHVKLEAQETSEDVRESLKKKMFSDFPNCPKKDLRKRYTQNGDFWILNNYIPASKVFKCDESITCTTHGDFTYLHNLKVLAPRWKGPLSVSVFVPGVDFHSSIRMILYLRECGPKEIKELVSFHFIFPIKHRPVRVPPTSKILKEKINCHNYTLPSMATTYKKKRNLYYPVNVARNVARLNSNTYFNFPSDIELFPSLDFIPNFFEMLKRPDVSNTTNDRVYVFPIFEIEKDQLVPDTKAELQDMIKADKAIPFHQRVCSSCHRQPKTLEWIEDEPGTNLSVFHIGSRQPPYGSWEPIYVGTEREPFYDERLTWEGKSDKMTQMYILCVRDYEFHILDNAFLVHKPGIKKRRKDSLRNRLAKDQSELIGKKIFPEYRALFGIRKGCHI